MSLQGFKVVGTRVRPTLTAAGVAQNEVAIDLETDLGSTGQFVIPEREYNTISNQELANRLIEAAFRLDRAKLLVDTNELDDQE